MTRLSYTLKEHVAHITMNDGENRFNPDFLTEFLAILDKVEQQTEAKTLVVSSGHEKIWCNGLDLEWLAPVIKNNRTSEAVDFFFLLNTLYRRVLLYPMVTVAAMTGHAFAGGAIFSCAFDFRFMRSDRGFFCLPEIDLGIPFLPGMLALLRKAIPFNVLEELQYSGKRITAEQCVQRGIVTRALHKDKLLGQTLDFALEFKKNRDITREMKHRLYRDIVRIFDKEDPEYIQSGNYHIT
jgi:enoyl-CoA hydratase/carnithine racemase